MEKTTLDLWVGIFVAAGCAALIVLALKVGNLGSSFGGGDTYILKASFENIGGLKVRAPVKSAGVVVGRVNEIRFDTGTYQAVVDMSIDSRYKFPKDTFAKVLTSGLLGEQYVGLTAGGDEAMLKGGDKIMKAESAVVLENLIGQFLYDKAAEGGKTEGGKSK